MNKQCYEKLSKALTNGPQSNRMVARLLLEEPEFKTTQEFSMIAGISYSSVSRFVRRIGYPSFKHFIYEYNENLGAEEHEREVVNANLTEDINSIASFYQGEINIVSSRRGKAIAKFLNERLNDLDLPNNYLSESQGNPKEFVDSITELDSVILLTISGYSKIIDDVLTLIAKKPKGYRPNIIIFTLKDWVNVFEEQNENVKIVHLNKNHFDFDNWSDYNELCIECSKILFSTINTYIEKKNILS